MDAGYQGNYQNGNAREADFQKLAQNIGTNIQKILQNGTIDQQFSYIYVLGRTFSEVLFWLG
jgi:hypothetical protein